jgi:hypothetical protein
LCVVVVTKSECGTGLGCTPRGDEAGDVRHVHHRPRADSRPRSADPLEVDDARVGARAAMIIFGLCSRASLSSSS